MPTVGEFYDDLRFDLARGTSLDQRLPTWSRQALRHLERNHSFEYMKGTYVMVPLPNSRSFTFNLPKLKSIEAFGYLGADYGVVPFSKMNRGSIAGLGGDRPSRYWLEGEKIHFEGLFEEVYPLALRVASFTTWSDDQTATHPMLSFADDLLKWQVLTTAAASGFRAEKMQTWAAMREEALKTALLADDELSGETDMVMEYRGGADGQLWPRGSETLFPLEGVYQLPGVSNVAGLYHVG